MFTSYLYVLAPGIRAVNTLALNSPGNMSVIQTLDLASVAPSVNTSTSLSKASSPSAYLKF